MKKQIRNSFWMVAIATASLAMSMTACSSDDRSDEVRLQGKNETVNAFTTDPVESSTLYACGISQNGTRGVTEAANVVFTEDDILWFDVNTRELKFKDTERLRVGEPRSGMEPIYKKLEPFHEIEIRLDDDALFVVSTFVGLWDSRVFENLVLCYGKMDGEVSLDGNYYLYDCYPLQFINEERVQANIKKNAEQWETFTKYLENKGKLRK